MSQEVEQRPPAGDVPREPPNRGHHSLPERVAARLDRKGSYPRWVLLVSLSGLFATAFPITVLTLALPTIAEDFGVGEAELAWVITLPILASALALPLLGKLGDLYGHRRVFLTGFALATITTALTATAGNAVLLIAWRTVTQVLGGSTAPSSMALINSEHHGARRSKAMGWWSMTAAGAPVLGLALGAPVIEIIGWRTLFLLQAGFMVVPAVASWLVLRETTRKEARFDVGGALTLAVGVGALMLAVSQVPDWGVTHPVILGCAVVGPLGLLAFVWVERRVAFPLVPLAFFRTRDSSAAIMASFFSSASYMGAFFLASLLMVERFGYTLISAVPILSIRPALFAVSSPGGGWLAGRAGNRVTAVAGNLAMVGGLVALAVGADIKSIFVVVALGFLFQGIGFGLLRPAISTALANSVAQEDLGVAGAAERLSSQIGVAVGITVLASIYAGDVNRFPPALLVGAGFAALGAAASSRMLRASRASPDHDGSREAVVHVGGEEIPA